jgi:hypothetical protein
MGVGAITRQVLERTEKTASRPIVPLRTALFGGAALLILFAWLHLILALQIASTGRQIQMATEELNKLRRDNLAVIRDTAIAGSEENMTKRAEAMGYALQAPVYLSLGQTLSTTGPAVGAAQDDAGRPGGAGQGGIVTQFLLDTRLYDTITSQKEASGSDGDSAASTP